MTGILFRLALRDGVLASGRMTNASEQPPRDRLSDAARSRGRSQFVVAVVLLVLVFAFVAELSRPASAELDNHVFTSRADRIRLVVPRGWRESDAPSYPGLLLWMMRPDANIVLTAEPFTRELYCSWPVTCRTSHEASSMTAKYACALRQKLTTQRMRVGPVQAGPKENEEAGLPSVWFDYDDGKHYLRQAVVLGEDRAMSLVLSSPSAEARTSSARAFEQTLRTLRPLRTGELGAGPGGNGSAASGQGPNQGSARAGSATGSATVPDDAAPTTITAAAAAELPAPTPKRNPVGACTR